MHFNREQYSVCACAGRQNGTRRRARLRRRQRRRRTLMIMHLKFHATQPRRKFEIHYIEFSRGGRERARTADRASLLCRFQLINSPDPLRPSSSWSSCPFLIWQIIRFKACSECLRVCVEHQIATTIKIFRAGCFTRASRLRFLCCACDLSDRRVN